jgi:protein disulfide-isomerase
MTMGLTQGIYADEILMKGAKTGKWTMDYDAALKLANDKNMPVFLKFTGSDWCQWCILMEKNVFTKKEWSDFAAGKIVLVTLDFPRNSKLPDDMASRNNQLAQAMGVRGYPTYIILDSDGRTKLGQLGAGQDKTSSSFIEELENVLKYSRASIESFAGTLSPDSKTKYLSYFAEMQNLENERNEWAKTVTAWTPDKVSAYEDYENRLKEISMKIRDMEIDKYASALDASDANQYRILNSKLKAAQAEFDAWLATRPQRNEENTKLYENYQSRVQALTMDISQYENKRD